MLLTLTADEIADHPALHDFIKRQSQALLMTYEADPRLAAVFATQQRWLMAHVGLALYFRRDPEHSGFNAAAFLDAVRNHAVASRNTADAFMKEMLKYGIVQYGAEGRDKRARPMEPAPATLDAINGWVMVHLATLDSLDGGSRLTTFLATPEALPRIQPLICDGLLTSRPVREPERTFSLFTWLNNGGIIMERLITGMQDADAGAKRFSTSITSITEMGDWLSLSRTHLARKLREAESLGSIGWHGKRGNSVMWVSKGFRREIAMAQAVKLAIIDTAFDACFTSEIG